jgi:hypothetical protein
MALSWNEIKERAVRFSKEWENEANEDAEAKSFLDDFFNVFGVNRRRLANFEKRVNKEDGKQGYIDLLWKSTILIECKSRGKDLDKAHQQAKDYFPGLKDGELPKYILVTDFDRFRLYDLEDDKTIEFQLKDFVNNVQHFGFIAGYQKKVFHEQDPANIKAAELMGMLHDRLEEIGYIGHPLEIYLVRILFCLFAEDTTIFNKQQFQDYIEQRTNEDGSDLAAKLQELFQVLNTPSDKRFKNLDEQLAEFPYVNGKLFEEQLPTASFDSKMRQALLNCCYLDWSKISPAIFGSMFQSVMNPQERRNLGAHYTSEKNILKLIRPLFLDELWAEFDTIKANKNKLHEFHKKIASLKFLDPACGCGNFLVITYRELRMLEIEILRAMNKSGQTFLNVNDIIWLDVDMMYGIEYEEFPARIAEVAMWLIDHQMNMRISNEFGQYFVRLPLKKAATIVHGNALQLEWEDVVPKEKLSYILGNPPFIGKQLQKPYQKDDMVKVFGDIKGSGTLDYVCGWYIKAAQIIQNSSIKVGFVSTSSITQGEQVGLLWNILFSQYSIKIHFAHQTFKWGNEAKGNAAVHVVIIGFAAFDTTTKFIFEYSDIKAEPHVKRAYNINPYLFEGKDIFLLSRDRPICKVPQMFKGSQPTDGGNLLLSRQEYLDFIAKEPKAKKFIKPFVSADEYINGEKRYCLWLVGATPDELKAMPLVMERLNGVKKMRLASTKAATRKWAEKPMLFTENRQPNSNYIIVPSVSSEKRKYIPLGFMSPKVVASNLCLIIPDAGLYHFAVLTSEMHMSWVRYTCGRLKSDYRYSNTIVYNNFPWPENPSKKQIEAIEKNAQKVLDIRSEYPKCSLADLYDPLTTPSALLKAHIELDRSVDLAYRSQPFPSDARRMEYLFELYEKYTADLFTTEKLKKAKSG